MININKFFFLCLSFTVALNTSIATAGNDFQDWLQQQSHGVQAQKDEFEEYKDKRDKQFTRFLKSQWKVVDIVKGEVRDEEPKPEVMPVATPKPLPEQQPQSQPQAPVIIVLPKPVLTKKPVPAPVVVREKGKSINIEFYGRQLRFYYDGRSKQRLVQ